MIGKTEDLVFLHCEFQQKVPKPNGGEALIRAAGLCSGAVGAEQGGEEAEYRQRKAELECTDGMALNCW